MADRRDIDFTYSLTDQVIRLSLGELADFSAATVEHADRGAKPSKDAAQGPAATSLAHERRLPARVHITRELIADMGYVPVDLGGTDTCHVMEAPRRPGAVYGEEYHAADAQAVVDAVRNGVEIPATPSYE